VTDPAPDFNPNIDDDETEESEETSPPEGEEQPPANDDQKAKRALDRMKRERDKARKDLADLRKAQKDGDPNAGEAEQLKQTVEKLQAQISTSNAVSALLEAGFNGSRTQAEKLLRTVDDLSDHDTLVDELKVDFPEKFGRKAGPAGPRPHTGSGRPDQDGTPKKSADSRHVDKLLQMGRRS